MSSRCLFVFSIAWLIIGCASPREPVRPSPKPDTAAAGVELSYYSGTVYGPQPSSDTDAIRPGIPYLSIRSFRVREFPWNTLRSVASRSRVMVNPDSSTPFTARFSQVSRARVGTVAELEAASGPDSTELEQAEGVLAPGISGVIRVAPSGSSVLSVHVNSSSERPIAADIALTDATGRPVVLASRLTVENPVALVLPCDDDRTGIAMILEIAAPPTDRSEHYASYQRALAHAREALAHAREALSASDSVSPLGERTAGLRETILSLRDSWNRRATLVYLGSRCDAQICEELGLASSDQALVAIAKGIVTEYQSLESALEPDQLGILLEGSAIRALYGLNQAGRWTPELTSILVGQVGELANHPSVLSDLVSSCRTVDQLRVRCVQENMIFLEDSSPSARERAHEWLLARDLAPPDYDPWSPAKERRAALAKHVESSETKRNDRGANR